MKVLALITSTIIITSLSLAHGVDDNSQLVAINVLFKTIEFNKILG